MAVVLPTHYIFRGVPLFLALAFATSALEVHEFSLGCNAIVNFSKTLNTYNSSEVCELFTLNEERPFYKDKQIDPTALQPQQQGRFTVKIDKKEENFTATLQIADIQQGDEGVYILALKETDSETSTTHIVDAYVDVIVPVSKAVCTVQKHSFSSGWKQVFCEANLSSSGDGDLICYQDSKEAPYYGSMLKTATHVQGTFWMLPKSRMSCCSFHNYRTGPESCNDVIFQPDISSHVTSKPQHTTERGHKPSVTPTAAEGKYTAEFERHMKTTLSPSCSCTDKTGSVSMAIGTLSVNIATILVLIFMSIRPIREYKHKYFTCYDGQKADIKGVNKHTCNNIEDKHNNIEEVPSSA